jgi:hypothetical protein
LGKGLPIILIRNQLKNVLKKEPFFQKLSKRYQARFLDSYTVCNVEKGKTIIDTYKKLRNSIVFILEGQIDVVFPKFISSKQSQKILSSIKEIRNTNKENLDKKQLFGLEAIKKAASC